MLMPLQALQALLSRLHEVMILLGQVVSAEPLLGFPALCNLPLLNLMVSIKTQAFSQFPEASCIAYKGLCRRTYIPTCLGKQYNLCASIAADRTIFGTSCTTWKTVGKAPHVVGSAGGAPVSAPLTLIVGDAAAMRAFG
eukprot:CAMPEP_0172922328 /NCGR_PEP_ID=MMETSP1075-20121228/207619_1 /TAXON_ID=2916 /ORGANISM="Ceratium fusus, Strain PA161109" /LENGTH=138 /DNA_ID=CAMNT_0013782635 /DNA_START=253 /DNA_END=670 /DNA_ORIENTATION=-